MTEVFAYFGYYLMLINWKLDDFCQDGMCFELDEDDYWWHVGIMGEDIDKMVRELLHGGEE